MLPNHREYGGIKKTEGPRCTYNVYYYRFPLLLACTTLSTKPWAGSITQGQKDKGEATRAAQKERINRGSIMHGSGLRVQWVAFGELQMWYLTYNSVPA